MELRILYLFNFVPMTHKGPDDEGPILVPEDRDDNVETLFGDILVREALRAIQEIMKDGIDPFDREARPQ